MMVGGTPLLNLPGHRILLKMEGCNPTGSLYDRAIFPMLKGKAEQQKLLLADWGPFALSAAWAAKLLERELEIWLPEHAPKRFSMKLEQFPCKVKHFNKPLAELRQIAASEDCEILDPWADPEHPMAYCESLAEELWQQSGGNLSAFVSGTDSCACLMGCSTGLKIKNPGILAVAAPISLEFCGNHDPLGDADPEFYVPQLCDMLSYCSLQGAQKAREWLWETCRIPCGLIGGAALHAALQLEKEISGNIAVILPSRYDCF